VGFPCDYPLFYGIVGIIEEVKKAKGIYVYFLCAGKPRKRRGVKNTIPFLPDSLSPGTTAWKNERGLSPR